MHGAKVAGTTQPGLPLPAAPGHSRGCVVRPRWKVPLTAAGWSALPRAHSTCLDGLALMRSRSTVCSRVIAVCA